ncbi:MAG: CusA/CzcA family heavy metal efflux RND transporter [Bacteroidetes bacterium]|nr:CusA/CzcA family heavy metal efflux RND transporter [Bacteroidota bacterium]
MLNKIIEFSVRNKLIILLFILALIGYGSYELTRLPIDAVPDITDNQVQIITVTPSLGAPDVERLITFPIELANSNIPGIKEIRSFSRFGLSLVTVVFKDDVDVYWARQQVSERLISVQDQIPKGIGSPSLAPVTTGLGEVYQYVVKAKPGYEGKYDAMQLRTIQDWIVRRQLLGVAGVADVSSFGGYLKQYEVAVNTAKLAALNVSIREIFDALEKNNGNTGGAYIEKGPTVLYIRSEGLTKSIKDIENIAVKYTANGTPIFVRDVAEVHIGAAIRYGAMCYNDKGEVSGAVVMMLKGANSGQVIKNIKSRVAQIQKMLPEGVMIEPFLDRTKMVDHAIGTVEKNLLEGSLIVIFVLVLFLGNFRAGLLVASIIPLAMLFAIIMMNLFGVSGNLMSLGALDFGLIVDGAVIIVEAVMHRLHEKDRFSGISKLSQPQMDAEVNTSASRMMNSSVFGQVIILIVYLPIFSLRGIEGKMFRPMAETVAFALLGAFILSLTYIPMMSSVVLSKKITDKEGFSAKAMRSIEHRYKRMLEKALHYPKIAIATAVGLFAVAMVILLSMGGEFIPQLEEGDFAVDTRVLTGSNLHTTINATQKASSILLNRFPEVEKVVTKIGSGEIPTDPMPMEACDMMVILKDKKEWTSARTFPEMAEKMGAALNEVPGITTGFQFPVQMRFNELMTGARQDVVCKIFGEDLDTLASLAGKLGKLTTTVQGAKDLYVEAVTGLPQIVIDYNRAMIAQYGLDIETVNNIINTAFGGQSTGLVYEGEKRFDMVVRLAGDQKKNVADVQNLLIPTAHGAEIPLSQLATVTIKEGPNQIQREDAKRRIIVGFNVRGRDVQSIVNELQQKAASIKLPAGYYITYGGAFENLEAAKKRLSIVVPIALGLIFLMLYFAFRSVKHSLIIYTAIPLSAIGGTFALAARGMPFSISAGVGFIALFGVAVLNGIVLISEFRRLQKEGLTDLNEIVMRGTSVRLRPVLMTAAVASLGFLPMALSNGAGAEVQRPLATVVIGGLLTATLLTLFLLPILFTVFEKRKNKMNAPTTLLMLLLALPFASHAQTSIGLDDAIDSARRNNLKLRTARLTADYYKKMKGTAFDPGQTSVTAELGHVNSAYTDNKIGITQSIAFPIVYNRQHAVLRTEWRSATTQAALKEKELEKQVSILYNEINNLYQKRKLLADADSLYAEFLRKSELRLKLGESNVLEKIAAENQSLQINLQLQQIETSIQQLNDQFNYVLNTDVTLVPDTILLKLNPGTLQEEELSRHPFIQYMQLQQQLAKTQYQLEKSKLLPSLMAGYYNQSFAGWQNVNNVERYYTTSDRFNSVQVGVGIPILFTGQQARIKAMSINRSIAASQLQDAKNDLAMQYQQALASYTLAAKELSYYEQTALPNAYSIKDVASQQYYGGEIGYLEYIMLINQSITIRSNYYEALRKLNESVLQLNYLTKNNN